MAKEDTTGLVIVKSNAPWWAGLTPSAIISRIVSKYQSGPEREHAYGEVNQTLDPIGKLNLRKARSGARSGSLYDNLQQCPT